jgi:heterodisulfide reductase subunit C
MDVFPNQIIRMVQMGMEREVLNTNTIWTCVGCNTCSSVCPMAIDMAAIMDALRQMAIEQKIQPGEPDVLAFHQAVLASVERYGRSHKLEIMMRFKLQKRDFFSDFNVGLKMLRKKKLDLTPSKVGDIKAIRKIFKESRLEWPHG